MGFSVVQKAEIPIGQTLEESQKLLDQTAAAMAASVVTGRDLVDFSGIEDVSGIVESSVSGELLTISELGAMRRTLRAAKGFFERLERMSVCGDCSARYYSSIIIY